MAEEILLKHKAVVHYVEDPHTKKKYESIVDKATGEILFHGPVEERKEES